MGPTSTDLLNLNLLLRKRSRLKNHLWLPTILELNTRTPITWTRLKMECPHPLRQRKDLSWWDQNILESRILDTNIILHLPVDNCPKLKLSQLQLFLRKLMVNFCTHCPYMDLESRLRMLTTLKWKNSLVNLLWLVPNSRAWMTNVNIILISRKLTL